MKPRNIISRPYKVRSMQYKDQLDESNDIWVCSGIFNRYLSNKYGLTTKEYLNLIEYNDINHVEICKCPGCNNSVKFISLSRGYHSYCSLSCGSKVNCTISRNDKFSKQNIELNKALSSSEFKFNSGIRINRLNFINTGSPDDECIFYLGFNESMNRIKLGITCSHLDRRMHDNKLSTIHSVIKGKRKYIADLEFYLKSNLKCINEYVEYHELSKVINLIKLFKISSETIETTDKESGKE